MHCTVKKMAQLIVDGGNDYLSPLENQPRLLAQLETLAQQTLPQSRFADGETRGDYLSQCLFLTLLELTAIGQDSKV